MRFKGLSIMISAFLLSSFFLCGNLKAQTSPAAPSNLIGTAVYYDQIKLNWVDNSINEDGFNIYKVVSAGVYQLIGTAGVNKTFFYASYLQPNTQYKFVVAAYNTYGNSSYSNEVSVTTPPQSGGDIPLPPSNLMITDVQTASITIHWQDNSNNEAGFKIARRTSLDTTFIVIDSAAPDVLTYQEVGLSPATRYYYKVCSYNRYGFSSYSNIVTEVTQSTGIEPYPLIPGSYYLKNNYPNPFNPSTNIEFGLPKNSDVKLTIFNSLGKKIETLVDTRLNAGTYSVTWNALRYNSGMYFCVLETDAFKETKKMLMIK